MENLFEELDLFEKEQTEKERRSPDKIKWYNLDDRLHYNQYLRRRYERREFESEYERSYDRYGVVKRKLTCRCGEEYTISLEAEKFWDYPHNLDGSPFEAVQYQRSKIYCIKCGNVWVFAGKILKVSSKLLDYYSRRS